MQIHNLPAQTTAADADVLAIDNGTTTQKITAANIKKKMIGTTDISSLSTDGTVTGALAKLNTDLTWSVNTQKTISLGWVPCACVSQIEVDVILGTCFKTISGRLRVTAGTFYFRQNGNSIMSNINMATTDKVTATMSAYGNGICRLLFSFDSSVSFSFGTTGLVYISGFVVESY